ncbi:hypothetical protein T4D_9243 [Trichinella pseudospiralis]|uniref:Uncharacterized protein n=1 Tax=Trichinella pseudospiralis TaxID=6337 RepID=A0A0V1FDE5_TRIPS|nr:hypothetical protein T4D_9243 [Trichinella pseudospiralis]
MLAKENLPITCFASIRVGVEKNGQMFNADCILPEDIIIGLIRNRNIYTLKNAWHVKTPLLNYRTVQTLKQLDPVQCLATNDNCLPAKDLKMTLSCTMQISLMTHDVCEALIDSWECRSGDRNRALSSSPASPAEAAAVHTRNIDHHRCLLFNSVHKDRKSILDRGNFLCTMENISQRQVSLFASIRHSKFKLHCVHLKMLIKVGSIIRRCRFLSTLARFSSPP